MQLIESIFIKLQAYFSIDRFGDLLSGLFVKVVIFVLVLIVFYILWWLLSRLIESTLNRRFDKTSASFASILIKICLFGIGFVVALSAAGVETAALLGSLGVVGLTLGFALKDVMSNIISGVLLHVDRPFTVDDLVEVDGKYGRVDLITLRTTRIVTNDGKMVAVPNAEVMNKTVTSYTNFPNIRLDIAVTVGVHEDLDRVRKILLDLVFDNPVHEIQCRLILTEERAPQMNLFETAHHRQRSAAAATIRSLQAQRGQKSVQFAELVGGTLSTRNYRLCTWQGFPSRRLPSAAPVKTRRRLSRRVVLSPCSLGFRPGNMVRVVYSGGWWERPYHYEMSYARISGRWHWLQKQASHSWELVGWVD